MFKSRYGHSMLWCPKLVKGDWITDDTIIIDIGTNKLTNKLVGDVDFDKIRDRCSYITPVPGGIGPMTIMMVIKQTVESCIRKI